MSGSNIVNQKGVYGTQGIGSSTNIPGARDGGVGWFDASKREIWLFGGYGYASVANAEGTMQMFACFKHLSCGGKG